MVGRSRGLSRLRTLRGGPGPGPTPGRVVGCVGVVINWGHLGLFISRLSVFPP